MLQIWGPRGTAVLVQSSMCCFCRLSHIAHYKAKDTESKQCNSLSCACTHAHTHTHTNTHTHTHTCTHTHTLTCTHTHTHSLSHTHTHACARTHAHTHTHTHIHTLSVGQLEADRFWVRLIFFLHVMQAFCFSVVCIHCCECSEGRLCMCYKKHPWHSTC